MRINIPGLEGIDIDEILGRASTIPRPPLNKKRPLPKEPEEIGVDYQSHYDRLASRIPPRKPTPYTGPVRRRELISGESPSPSQPPSPRRSPNIMGSIPGAGGTTTINIPGVGPIQIPMPETPGSGEWEPRETQTDYKEKIKFEGSMDGTTDRDISKMTWEEIDKEMNDIRFASRDTWGGGGSRGMPDRYEELKAQYESIAPISELEAAYDRLIGVPNAGEVYLKEGERLKKLIESRRGPQETNQAPVFDDEESTRTGPIETTTETETETETSPPPPPPVNPFKGFVPGNIIGQSFDPKDLSAHQKTVADARARQKPGGYLTYDNPILGNKQTQFGGYGQPMPTKPLMNYAGLASPITYSTPKPDPDKEIIR
jgi:hypothetical protein